MIRERIGEGIELLIEGLPPAIVSAETQAKAVLGLVRYGIPAAGTISAGVLLGVRSAALKIGSEIYQIKYSIVVLKAITALEIYSQAIQWIDFQKEHNRVDGELADSTIEFLRDSLRQEHQRWLRG